MKKYTNSELAQLYDKKDWAALWKIMTPMVKHAVRRCMQDGLDPHYVNEDLMQEAYLAAWKALPKWNAFEASLQTWIREKVRSAVLDANQRESSGMVGGKRSGGYVESIHGETPEADYVGSNDEQGIADGIEATLVYTEVPEGFEDPADLLYLLPIPLKDRDMVRRLAGLGVPRETQAEYAHREGISRRTVVGRLESLKKLLRKK